MVQFIVGVLIALIIVMSDSKFDFLAGSLPLEGKPFHMQIGNLIKRVFKSNEGYVGYKLTTLGRTSDEDVPSFIIITKEHGIILIDVVEEKVNLAEESKVKSGI